MMFEPKKVTPGWYASKTRVTLAEIPVFALVHESGTKVIGQGGFFGNAQTGIIAQMAKVGHWSTINNNFLEHWTLVHSDQQDKLNAELAWRILNNDFQEN